MPKRFEKHNKGFSAESTTTYIAIIGPYGLSEFLQLEIIFWHLQIMFPT